MGKGTEVVAHEGTDTGIFYKCGHGEGLCSTLLIGYPLSSLNPHHNQIKKMINVSCPIGASNIYD